MVVAASTVSTGRSSISTAPKNHSLSSRQNDASPNPSRRPLIPSERDNAAVARRLPAKEISSRYLSSCTSASSITPSSHTSNTTTSSSSSCSASSRRFPSPGPNHRPSTPPSFSQRTAARRSYSVDRTRPTTPRVDSRGGGGDGVVLGMSNAGRALCTTTRSLSVSFQGEPFFYQTSKAKNPSPVPTRKHPTPERRRASTPTRNSTPYTGEKSLDQHHHCWPAARSRQSNLLTKSLDCSSDKDPILSTAQLLRQSMLSVNGSRRPSSDGADFSISSDTDSLSSGSNPGTPELRFPTRAPASPGLLGMPTRIRQEMNGRLLSLPHHGTPLSSSSSKSSASLKMPSVRRSPADNSVLPPPRSASSPLRGPVRPSCLSKVAGSPCRGTSSPSRGRGNSTLSNASSITSFAAAPRRNKKGVSPIEEAHMLRVLYNKHLHWRHANARANAALLTQRVSAEVNC
ncbi:hypothetical protein KSP39_PZI015243 [Platanthera zijinensis]|uniref:Uncharacterized protein n=1 Tax=Platanthera zijinensis TaxID=2320716 RepID=A0AAP0B8Z3_9ASPA